MNSIWEGLPVGSAGEESTCHARDMGSIPGSGRSPGEGMAAHSSILAWKNCSIPWTEEPSGLQSMGSQRVRHDWVTNTFTFSERQWSNPGREELPTVFE